MHAIAKVKSGTIIVNVPDKWEGKELDVEINLISTEVPLFKAIDEISGGKRVDSSKWKFDRDEIHEK